MIFYKQLGDRDKNGAVADFFIFEKTVVFPGKTWYNKYAYPSIFHIRTADPRKETSPFEDA